MITRRDMILGGAIAPLSLAHAASASTSQPVVSAKGKSTRIVHLTDSHVQPELGAPKGLALCLDHIMKQKHKPAALLFGGDLIMDAYAQTEARTRTQWDIFTKTCRDHTNIQSFHAIGNHDPWGWSKKDSATTGSERLWGKKWFLDLFGYERTYHAHQVGGWNVIVIDNIFLTPDGYNAIIDPEQMAWVDQTLGQDKRPTVIMTHIPILSVTTLAGAYDDKTGDWTVGGNSMTKNWNALKVLFRKHRHVKICLSGHTHQLDRVDYDGVSYLCGGAICGAWWKGANNGVMPGYRILDLNTDGTFKEQYIPWGWTEAIAEGK